MKRKPKPEDIAETLKLLDKLAERMQDPTKTESELLEAWVKATGTKPTTKK